MDLIPSKYDQVVGELNIMYSMDKKAIDIANKDMIDFVKDIKAEHRKKYNWYSDHVFSPNQNREMIDYMLNNYLYKNEVQGYWNLSRAQLNNTLSYRNRAVRIYQELAMLLNMPTVHDSFKVDPEVVNLLVGTYKLISEDGVYDPEEYKFENNLIMTYKPLQPDIAWENTFIDLKKTKSKSVISMLRNSGAVYMTYIIEGDSLSVINNGGNTWKFIKVK